MADWTQRDLEDPRRRAHLPDGDYKVTLREQKFGATQSVIYRKSGGRGKWLAHLSWVPKGGGPRCANNTLIADDDVGDPTSSRVPAYGRALGFNDAAKRASDWCEAEQRRRPEIPAGLLDD